jgi:hypothetical protein
MKWFMFYFSPSFGEAPWTETEPRAQPENRAGKPSALEEFSQARCPVPRDLLQKTAQLLEASNLLAECTDFLPGQRVNHATGRMAEVALAEDAGQFGEREAGAKGALYHQDSIERLGGVDPVAVCGTRRVREHPNALVVAERIGAQAGQTG